MKIARFSLLVVAVALALMPVGASASQVHWPHWPQRGHWTRLATPTPTPASHRKTASVPTATATPSSTSSPSPQPAGPIGNWTLAYQDEFNGSSLDTGRWRSCHWWGCRGGLGWDQNCHLAANNTEHDGSLDVLGQRQSGNCKPDGTAYTYTSGAVNTGTSGWQSSDTLYAQTYGFFEARIWMQAGQGYEGGFWMMHPGIGAGDLNGWDELDIVELLGREPNIAYLTVHWPDVNRNQASDSTRWSGPDFTTGWHTFGIDWEPGSLTWYVDGVARKTTTQHVPSTAMDLRADFNIGGSWAGNPDSTTPLPGHFKVDYIRAWRH